MPLVPGARIGQYEIVTLLGAGGMGEVYRARDARLQRDVAIKIVRDFPGGGPDRVARFRREAQVLASLNHPHIGAIYGVEEAGESRALVLELVDGPTLADRIARGRIPLDEAIPIATQIADALGAAHDHGVIHRDLKPANIKLRPDGTVKVLDFGLAKVFADESGASEPFNSPTLSLGATHAGVILGTAAYMSPRNRRVARRWTSGPTCGRLAACSTRCSLGVVRSAATRCPTRWSRDGKELFYVTARGIMSMPVDTSQPTFHWGSPTLLFESYSSFPSLAGPRNYDQAPDGRFLVIKESLGTGPGAIVIVKNWFDEIKRLAPASR